MKPFGVEELMARIRAALRRVDTGRIDSAFCFRGAHDHFEKRAVALEGKPVRLTPKEFELLRQLVVNQGKAQGTSEAAPGRLGARLRRRNRVPTRFH